MKYCVPWFTCRTLKPLESFSGLLGLEEIDRYDSKMGEFTLIYLAALRNLEPIRPERIPVLALTYNRAGEDYQGERHSGRLDYEVDDVYAICQKTMDPAMTIIAPPKGGHQAFFRSPDNISMALLQKGESLPARES